MKVTLANLHEVTAQQVFDQVLNHLRQQGKQSRADVQGCLYRGPNGLKCAAGSLIADDEYVQEMDNAEDTSWDYLETIGIVPHTGHSEMIAEIQNIHDNYGPYHSNRGKTFAEYINEEFEELAKRFNLEYKAN